MSGIRQFRYAADLNREAHDLLGLASKIEFDFGAKPAVCNPDMPSRIADLRRRLSDLGVKCDLAAADIREFVDAIVEGGESGSVAAPTAEELEELARHLNDAEVAAMAVGRARRMLSAL